MIHGIAARLASRWTVAERAFRRVTELWPEELDGWLELTWALATLDRPDGALAAAQRAVELRPDNPAALGNLASALLQNGRAKDALPVIHRALELDPSERKNQQIRDSVQAAATEPELELEPADETDRSLPGISAGFADPRKKCVGCAAYRNVELNHSSLVRGDGLVNRRLNRAAVTLASTRAHHVGLRAARISAISITAAPSMMRRRRR